MIPLAFAAALLLPGVQPPPQPAGAPPPLLYAYVPQRVYDTRQKGFADFEGMLADLTRADVVFVGEQHDDANTHRLELAILEGLMRRRVPLVIAMEMFERDVQPVLDRYLAGSDHGRRVPQGRRARGRATPPTTVRSSSSRGRTTCRSSPRTCRGTSRPTCHEAGSASSTASARDRRLAARELQCPTTGEYYDRFLEAMGGHPPSGDPQAADIQQKNDRFYFAQCLKDETMAESIADAFAEQRAAARDHRPHQRRVSQRLRRRAPQRRHAAACPAAALPSSASCRSRIWITSVPTTTI